MIDAEWESNLYQEVQHIEVELEAVLKTKPVLIEDIVNLQVGSTIVMDDFVDDDIIVKCSGSNMYSGKIGKVGDKIAVSITDILNKKLNKLEGKDL